ncbi:nucleotidyltransferase domain-containing protein [Methylomonas sp. MED-D]|uniref:nucleotidyltransferase domain-containing protein n=1 Tax=unclassified Methylomonas TaxID=2608980 RepID=UPI0028A4D919|nr:nucleotidyltransferase domain-containing protein [Methylomonas sp. MV1]MDT4331599.1 nucleotidyltransferase domain-containing protein [Methylomonas sp. MV1]
MNSSGLLLREQDKRCLLQLLTEYLPGVSAWAYGSRVNGDAHDASDLDIVLRAPDLSKIPLEKLESFLEAVRESNIPILIEARDWARLPESFHREILRNYVVLGE